MADQKSCEWKGEENISSVVALNGEDVYEGSVEGRIVQGGSPQGAHPPSVTPHPTANFYPSPLPEWWRNPPFH